MKQKKLLALILSFALALSLVQWSTPDSAAVTLSDIEGNWAEEYILRGVEAGYISGYSDGTYRPEATVTRGAFCKIINNALGLQATATVTFSDVHEGDTFYTEIQKAVYAGYISGYTDGTFRASQTITRQQAATMLARIIPNVKTYSKNITALADYGSIGEYALDSMTKLYEKGYLTADANNKIDPEGAMTRAQTAATIALILDGEHIVSQSLNFTTPNMVCSDIIYVNLLTVDLDSDGYLTFSNCKVLGKITASSPVTLNLTDSNAIAITCSSENIKVNVSGSASIANTYLTAPAVLTEQRDLTGSGFNNVSCNGSKLADGQTNLAGDFSTVVLSKPVQMSLLSGSIKTLTVASGAAGSTIALSDETTVDTATIDGACAFTGKGIIKTATQNVSDVTYETMPQIVNGSSTVVVTGTLKPLAVSPADQSKDVSVSTAITLTFADVLLTASGGILTASEVTAKVLELHSGSESGSKVPFTATIASNSKSITLTPSEHLSAGVTYYVILNAHTLQTADGNNNPAQSWSFTTSEPVLIPTVVPANQTTGVAVSDRISMTFPEAVYNTSGSVPTATYLKDTALELRQGSSSGTKVSFTAALSSDGKTITIDPASYLNGNTTYYVLLLEGTLQTSAGNQNAAQSWYFTTADVSLVPKLGQSSGVALDASLTLNFTEAVYDPAYEANVTPSSATLNGAFRLYKGNADTGTAVSIGSVVLSSDNRTITIRPAAALERNSTYTIELLEGYLRGASGTVNTRQQFTFTTVDYDALTPSVTPVNNATGVSITANVTLTFSEAIYNTSLQTPDSNYFTESVFELRQGSSAGETVPFSASLSNNGRTVTLDPNEYLSYGTQYYVILKAGTLQNASQTVNSAQVWTFTTVSSAALAPDISPADGATNVDKRETIRLTFAEAVYNAGNTALSSDYLYNTALELRANSVSGSRIAFTGSISSDSRTLTIVPSAALSADTRYYVILKANTLRNAAGVYNTYQTWTFTTAADSSTSQNNVTSISASNVGTDSLSVTFISESIGTADIILRTASGVTASDSKFGMAVQTGNNAVSFSGLEPNTAYTVIIYLTVNGETKAYTGTVQTATPVLTITPTYNSTDGSSVTLSVVSNYVGTITLKASGGTLSQNTFSNTTSASATLSGLSSGGSYTVAATLTYGSASQTVIATTAVEPKSSENMLFTFIAMTDSGNIVTVPIAAGSSSALLTIQAKAGETIQFSGSASQGASCTVSPSFMQAPISDAVQVVTVTVTAANNSSRIYTITVSIQITASTAS